MPAPTGSGQGASRAERGLIAVAHWNDEIISAWGAMLKFDAEVLCVTARPMPGYREIFDDPVRDCGCRPLHWMVSHRQPSGRFTHLHTQTNVQRRAELLTDKKYDRLMTHHFTGDIGIHPQHIMLANLCYDAILASGRKDVTGLYCFCSQRHVPLWPHGDGMETIRIDEDTLQKRLEYARRYKGDFDKR